MKISKFLNARTTFVVLLSAFAILGCVYSVTVPLGEAPDEVSHSAYIRYVAANWRLPPPVGEVTGEAHQPPLYYLIGAVSTAWAQHGDWQVIANPDFSLDDPQTPNLLLHPRSEGFPYQGASLQWHLLRLLSVVMGLVTVWATWRIALILLDGNEWMALGAAAFVAFLPEFTFISSMVNNDNLIIMLSALGTLQLLRMGGLLRSRRESLTLGLILGLAALTKLSGFVLWLLAFILYVAWGVQSRQWRAAAFHLVFSFGTAVLIASPWFIYNLTNLGDPVGWSRVLALTPLRQSGMTLGDWGSIASGLFTSFAGRFGGALQLRLQGWYYATFGLVLLLSILGWARYVIDARAGRFPDNRRNLVILFSLFWLLMLAAYVRWTSTALGTDQARQLFPGLPLLSVFLIAGIARLVKRYTNGTMLAIGGVGIALSLAVVFSLTMLYSPQPVFAQVSGAPPQADFGQTIRVLDYRIDRTTVKPGESIGVQFDWQALKPPAEDYWLQLQLAGADGVVANKDGVPSAGRLTTDWWSTGQVENSRHTFVVPVDAPPGSYNLTLGLHPFGRWDWLRVNGQDRLSLGQVIVAPATGG